MRLLKLLASGIVAFTIGLVAWSGISGLLGNPPRLGLVWREFAPLQTLSDGGSVSIPTIVITYPDDRVRALEARVAELEAAVNVQAADRQELASVREELERVREGQGGFDWLNPLATVLGSIIGVISWSVVWRFMRHGSTREAPSRSIAPGKKR